MKIEKTELEGVFIIRPDLFEDDRGYFYETYTKRKLEPEITSEFVQDNESHNASKGVIRGLHCQVAPNAQSKLIRCSWGGIKDVIVDIRKDSPTYMKHIEVTLTGNNRIQVFIPKGCLHGYITLCDDVTVLYKTDNYYSPECERRVRYDEPQFGIDWGVSRPIVSEADKVAKNYNPEDFKF